MPDAISMIVTRQRNHCRWKAKMCTEVGRYVLWVCAPGLWWGGKAGRSSKRCKGLIGWFQVVCLSGTRKGGFSLVTLHPVMLD